MTKQQAQWAEGHDWFRHAVEYGHNDWVVYVYDDYLQMMLTFHYFEALQSWAGY